MKQWQARQESRDLSKVTIRGLLSRSSGGWWSGGQPPYGYDLVYYSADRSFLMTVRYDHDLSKQILGEDGNLTRVVSRGQRLTFSKSDRCKLVPSSPQRVQTLRSIFAWYVHHGLGTKTIADRLNQQGVPSPRSGHWSKMHGDKWSMSTIREMLRNPAYVGDMVWNRLSFGKFHRVRQGMAVPRHYRPDAGPDQNRPHDWVVVRDAHPALISRELFETGRAKCQARKTANGGHTYRTGSNHTSPYLLAGLIRCTNCGHHWQGYTAVKGRRRKDGSNIRTPYYICGGHLTKGNSCCPRSAIPKEMIEQWVLDQIGRLIQDYIGKGGEERLQEMIRQEMAGVGGFNPADLDSIRQRRSDIEIKIGTLLDNLTATNREFVDRHIEKLRGEIVELDRAEALALEIQNQDSRAESFAREAIGVVRDFKRLVAEGTVEEKRTLIRAFLRVLDFDPVTRKGVAHFWVVPSVGQDEFVAGPLSERGSLRTHDQNGNSDGELHDGKNGPGNVAQTANASGETPEDAVSSTEWQSNPRSRPTTRPSSWPSCAYYPPLALHVTVPPIGTESVERPADGRSLATPLRATGCPAYRARVPLLLGSTCPYWTGGRRTSHYLRWRLERITPARFRTPSSEWPPPVPARISEIGFRCWAAVWPYSLFGVNPSDWTVQGVAISTL